ncbi:hypothetical protein [Vibrio parahaemolyticus]|uniref:hypothetical protein n=1 Tax=Vibrio parahaemolyticus TaxID=670 RepID=UPI001F1EF82B|nr:hypothetical protein [Vibrio parahaemolyticus]
MNLTNSVSASRPDVPAQPKAWSPRDKAQINAKELTEFLGFDVSDSIPYALLETAVRCSRTVTNPKEYSKLFSVRVDHYRNCIKFLCCSLLHLDLATNTIMAMDKAKGIIPAGNSLARNKLGMHRRTVDTCIATLKEAGLYLSNERYKFTTCPIEGRVFEGKHSIKRLFIGLFDLVGTSSFISKAIKRAKENALVRRNQKALAASNVNYGYKHTNRVRKQKRAERRAEAAAKKGTVDRALNLQPSRTQEQVLLLEKGYSHSEIKAHFDGSSPIIDDIPY